MFLLFLNAGKFSAELSSNSHSQPKLDNKSFDVSNLSSSHSKNSKSSMHKVFLK